MGEARLRNEPAMPKELDGAETFVLIDNISDGMSNRHVLLAKSGLPGHVAGTDNALAGTYESLASCIVVAS